MKSHQRIHTSKSCHPLSIPFQPLRDRGFILFSFPPIHSQEQTARGDAGSAPPSVVTRNRVAPCLLPEKSEVGGD